MPTMTISLSPELASFVEREVERGTYASASEVVGEGLRSLAWEQQIEAEKLAALRAAVQLGLDQAERGEFSSRTIEDIAREVMAEPM